MERNIIDTHIWRPTNPHDRFCRRTAFHPTYAPDFLRAFGGPVLPKYVDLDYLQEAPTTHLSDTLKEVIMDASLITRLLDAESMSEVLLHLEHKSKPSRTVVVQLLMEVALSLHFRWCSGNRPESEGFAPPIPLMIVVYNGTEDWEGEIWFQDLFPNLPEELRPFVPQFRVFVINLRRFRYGYLPGRPETRAIAESMMRATDGTFIEHLPGIFKHVAESSLGEPQRLGLTQNISSYCTYSAQADSDQIINAITNVFQGKEMQHMIETIKNEFVLEGYKNGKAEGVAEGEARGTVLTLLRVRFRSVPKDIERAVRAMMDLTALESLAVHAETCKSLDEFAEALK